METKLDILIIADFLPFVKNAYDTFNKRLLHIQYAGHFVVLYQKI